MSRRRSCESGCHAASHPSASTRFTSAANRSTERASKRLSPNCGTRAGITRFGDASVPMDEALATAVIDVGGRPYAVVDLPFRGERAGGLPLQLVDHALESFARTGGVTLHVRGTGRNDHHLAEAAFKALGRALRAACERDPRRDGAVASTKGVLG